jgi:hypothetical protein
VHKVLTTIPYFQVEQKVPKGLTTEAFIHPVASILFVVFQLYYYSISIILLDIYIQDKRK